MLALVASIHVLNARSAISEYVDWSAQAALTMTGRPFRRLLSRAVSAKFDGPRRFFRGPCRFPSAPFVVTAETGCTSLCSGPRAKRENRDEKDRCRHLPVARRRDAGAGRPRGGSDRRLQPWRLDLPLLGRGDGRGHGQGLRRALRPAARPQDLRDLRRPLALCGGRGPDRQGVQPRHEICRDLVRQAADLAELGRPARRAGRSREAEAAGRAEAPDPGQQRADPDAAEARPDRRDRA